MFRLIALTLLFSVGLMSEEDGSKIISLPAGSVYHGDYFAMGSNVEISGTVEGDLYLLAAQAFVDGHVKGDILVCAGNAQISGIVDNNVRAIAGQGTIDGNIGHSVTAIGGNVQLSSSAKLGGNLVCVAGTTEILSSITGDATVAASHLRVSGSIGDRLNAYVGKLRLTSKAHVGSDLEYKSDEEALIDPEAQIGGKIIHHTSVVQKFIGGGWLKGVIVGSKVVGFIMNFIYSFVVGWLLIRLFPRNFELAQEALSLHFLKCFGFGLMLLILLPLASLLLLMSILGVPFALTLIALNVITFYTVKIFPILWFTEKVFKGFNIKIGRYSALAIGLFAYFLLTPIPYFGIVLVLAALLLGLGAGAVAGLRRRIYD